MASPCSNHCATPCPSFSPARQAPVHVGLSSAAGCQSHIRQPSSVSRSQVSFPQGVSQLICTESGSPGKQVDSVEANATPWADAIALNSTMVTVDKRAIRFTNLRSGSSSSPPASSWGERSCGVTSALGWVRIYPSAHRFWNADHLTLPLLRNGPRTLPRKSAAEREFERELFRRRQWRQ